MPAGTGAGAADYKVDIKFCRIGSWNIQVEPPSQREAGGSGRTTRMGHPGKEQPAHSDLGPRGRWTGP